MATESVPLPLAGLLKILNHRITVLLVTVVLAIFVLWQAGSLVWKLWSLEENPPHMAATKVLPSKTRKTASLNNLLRYPLIPSISTLSKETSASINAPKTSLRLKLVGLMYSPDINSARAIIETPKDGGRSYAIGEKVAGKAEIYSIEPDRVILLRSGRHEALFLENAFNNNGIQRKSIAERLSGKDVKKNSPTPEPVSDKQLMNTLQDPDTLMQDFSAVPVIEGGKLQGFHLKTSRRADLLQKLGVDSNDLITAVNGISLNEPDQVMNLYKMLRSEKEFQITLQNGNGSRTITINMNQ